jgi:hypothetical protein
MCSCSFSPIICVMYVLSFLNGNTTEGLRGALVTVGGITYLLTSVTSYVVPINFFVLPTHRLNSSLLGMSHWNEQALRSVNGLTQ